MTAEQVKASILQLAIQGKLVPQDPNDEPASELLKRIEAAKDATGAKKSKPLPPISDDEKTFDIPDSWEWVRLGEIGEWGAGATPLKGKVRYYTGGTIPWLLTGDLNDGLITQIPNRITDIALKETSLKLNPKGSVLIAMYGATIGKVGILDIDSTTNQACCACVTNPSIDRWFLFYFLMAQRGTFRKRGEGGAQPNISKEKIIVTPIPLPPIAEQKRIAAKVEALFKYVDECEDSRKQLAEKLSGTLKRSVLQEAIQGRLVPQDPNDEPAGELLKRIAAKREKQITEKKIKRSKPLPLITDDEKPFSLPVGWEWTRLGEVCDVFNGNSINEQIKKTKYAVKCDGYSFIATPDVGFDSSINYESGVYIPKGEPKFRIAPKGSALMCIEGGSAARKFGFLDRDVMFGNKLCCFAPTIVNAKFIYWYLQSITFYSMFQGKMTGIIGGVGPETLRSFPIPLPPLAEQKRIVAKVDVLLAGIRSLRNMDEADAWVLNRRLEKHKERLCKKYNCTDIRFEAHKQDVPLQHPLSRAYMEVLYQRGGGIAVEALQSEASAVVGATLICTTTGGGIADENGYERMIFQVD